MKKKNVCNNTYFNREMTMYIETLLEAGDALEALESSMFSADMHESTSAELLRHSRRMDDLIVKIMEKRVVINDLLAANVTFGLS